MGVLSAVCLKETNIREDRIDGSYIKGHITHCARCGLLRRRVAVASGGCRLTTKRALDAIKWGKDLLNKLDKIGQTYLQIKCSYPHRKISFSIKSMDPTCSRTGHMTIRITSDFPISTMGNRLIAINSWITRGDFTTVFAEKLQNCFEYLNRSKCILHMHKLSSSCIICMVWRFRNLQHHFCIGYMFAIEKRACLYWTR